MRMCSAVAASAAAITWRKAQLLLLLLNLEAPNVECGMWNVECGMEVNLEVRGSGSLVLGGEASMCKF